MKEGGEKKEKNLIVSYFCNKLLVKPVQKANKGQLGLKLHIFAGSRDRGTKCLNHSLKYITRIRTHISVARWKVLTFYSCSFLLLPIKEGTSPADV